MLELSRTLLAPGARDAAENTTGGQTAVIDIGSNSIRLIIYRREGRAFWPIFNEKLLAGLGRGLGETGRLSADGVEMGLRTLQRFQMIVAARGVDEVIAFATAAVREAEDGADFAEAIRKTCGFEVQVLSGEEEGRLSALGAIAGGAEPEALVGDLGGSSLELCPVQEGRPGEGVTLRLGPLAVLGDKDFDPKALRKMVDKQLEAAAAQLETGARTFYAVGGAWRNLARLDMSIRSYPLHILHHYEMNRAEANKVIDFAISQSSDSLSAMPELSSRRAPMLPYAALLLGRVLERGDFDRIVISAFGVREGALFDRLPEPVRVEDPLLEGASAFARRLAPSSSVGTTLADWVAPLFSGGGVFDPGREAALHRAGASLADSGSAMHPDHRAELAADQILYAPFAGIDHAERAYLATALYHRYRGPSEPPDDLIPRVLAAPEAFERARSLGLALRLGCALSARAPALLKLARLSCDEKTVSLHVEKAGEALATEQVEKRLKQLASALNLEPQILRG